MTQREAAFAGYAPYADGEHPPYEFPRYASSTRRAPKRPLYAPPRTLSELTGPVFATNDVQAGENDLARGPDGAPVLGQLMIVTGRVLDEAGRPVPDTLVELWQANSAGKYNHPADEFAGAGRPAFLGLRALRHRRPGPLLLHHDQARRLSGPAHRQLVAPAAHPLLPVRPDLPHPPRHPDVLPGRSFERDRPHPGRRQRPRGPGAADGGAGA